MSDRNWWSRTQGVAEWATGNKWDFDNMGRPGSMSSGTVTGSPSSFSGAVGTPEWNKSLAGVLGNTGYQGGVKDSWQDAYFKAQMAKSMAGSFNKVGASGGSGAVGNLPNPATKLIQPFNTADGSWGNIAGIYNHPQQQGKGIMDRIAGAGMGFLKGAATGMPHMAGVGAVAGALG